MAVADLLEFFSTNSLSWEQLSKDAESEFMNLHYGLIHVGLPTIVNIGKDILPYIKGDAIPRNYVLCENGDISFADASEDTSEVAKVIEFTGIGNEKVVSGLHTIHGRDKQKKTIVGFKGYLFSSEAFHKQTRRIAQGSKVFSISSKNFVEIFVSIPSKEEQRKIADFLRLLDERIATQRRLIEDLEKLKTSIVDRCYRGNNNIKLGEFISQVSHRNRSNHTYKVMSVSNVRGFVPQSEQFADREIASENTMSYKIVTKDIFAYNPARINIGSIARFKGNDTGIVSPMYVCFKVEGGLQPQYLEHFFETRRFKNDVEVRLEGSVRRCLNFDALCEIEIPQLPLTEQVAISSALETVIRKIAIEENIFYKMDKQRKHLLSKMFI